MKEQTQDFQPSAASEALAYASQGLNTAYQKQLLVIAPSAPQVAFIKRAFDQKYWTIDHAKSTDGALRTFAESPNHIVIFDFAVCLHSQQSIAPHEVIERLCEINPNAIIVGLTGDESLVTPLPDIHKGIWQMIYWNNDAKTLKDLQEAVHEAWRTRLNRAEMELAQRVKVIELMNYENLSSREYGIRQACNELTGEIVELQNISKELEQDIGLTPTVHQLVETINLGLGKIGGTVEKFRNICIESEHKQNSIRL